ncbi:PhoD-like phosphatase [Thermosporothrix hazakensis]|jgi:phosphodiesterase/alkaline phosphatase D-like protein|uniref:PhoD-like phosphatase n=2 Tax=Thermosporothrix TaxID=768650 RepID=A0A326UAY6_THEHA|nr:alkaline phosphatase D family protein [Thermosporothrix hazakensis]PZW30451.1 PhoD-like phosphatase [Thermosporothrix hazakensis]BBH91167.1 alkaline phosphatase [Thermosporothrix sp. COM3]GCE49312.1 alkaline phosphatase [Thermosporothrix hazakensis]
MSTMPHLSIGPILRAIDSSHALLWAELSEPCIVTVIAQKEGASALERVTAYAHTIRVGNHYFAAVLLQGLEPASWYRYTMLTSTEADGTLIPLPTEQLHYLRTLPASTSAHQLRFVYGSCRQFHPQHTDPLSLFGNWLQAHATDKEQHWPHLLLLIGDQIYADRPSASFIERYPQFREGAHTFDDFAFLYHYAWTANEGIRQVLATLPTYMMFDDHEITNNWNTSPTWRQEALQQGLEQTIIDGMVAYWVYQGWGNILPHLYPQHPLLRIMQEAEQSGTDCLETLRNVMRAAIYKNYELPWHYTIPTSPTIFVTNTRADRTSVLQPESDARFAPLQIMGPQQMADLEQWLQAQTQTPALIVSSVPLLLPPLIGWFEYMAGVRGSSNNWFKKQLARFGLFLARKGDFDHWPLYHVTWNALRQQLARRQLDTLCFSGDVHFSYAATAQESSGARLHQLVCTPIHNSLARKHRLMIETQSYVTRASYGHLRTRILPLQALAPSVQLKRHLLYQDTLALVQLQTAPDGRYTLTQEYLSEVNGHLQPVAGIQLP